MQAVFMRVSPACFVGLPSPSRDRDGIGRREPIGTSYETWIIPELSITTVALTSQFWARPALARRDRRVASLVAYPGIGTFEPSHCNPGLGQGGTAKKRYPYLYPVEWGCAR